MAGGARGVINALGNLGGFCGPYAVGVLITLYSKDAGVYCLAVPGAGRADGAAAAGEMRCPPAGTTNPPNVRRMPCRGPAPPGNKKR
jgi:hypothetical protein